MELPLTGVLTVEIPLSSVDWILKVEFTVNPKTVEHRKDCEHLGLEEICLLDLTLINISNRQSVNLPPRFSNKAIEALFLDSVQELLSTL